MTKFYSNKLFTCPFLYLNSLESESISNFEMRLSEVKQFRILKDDGGVRHLIKFNEVCVVKR